MEGDYANAAAYYQQVLSNVKDAELKATIEQKYILSLIRKGDITQAEKLIAAYKKNYKNRQNAQAQFYIELGNYHRLQKNFKKAENYFKRVKKKYKNPILLMMPITFWL